MISRVLLVGLGSIGKRHLRLLRQRVPDADIRVLRRSGCSEHIPDADGCFDTLAAAIDFTPHAAVVASPPPFHLEVALALATAGTHLLVEKPLAEAPEGVARLITLAQSQGLVLRVGYNLRFLPSLGTYHAALRGGAIGSVHVIRAEVGQYLPSWRPGSDYRRGVSACQALGGGALLELSHELDYLRWCFGEVATVGATIRRQSALEVDVEDFVHATLEFRHGTGGMASPVASVSMDFLNHATTRRCTAIGADGTLIWDAVAGKVEYFAKDAEAPETLFEAATGRDASYIAQIDDFLSSIAGDGGESRAATGADGLAVLNIIDAARRSDAAEGRRVELAEGEG